MQRTVVDSELAVVVVVTVRGTKSTNKKPVRIRRFRSRDQNASCPDQVVDETSSANEQLKTSATTSGGLVDARYKRKEGRGTRGGGKVGMNGMMRIIG